MNGPGPRRYASEAAYGAVSGPSASAVGRPCTDSSQWRTSSRPGWAAAMSRSSRAKMTDRSSRFAYSSTTRPPPPVRAARARASTGVMPLPPATSSRSASASRRVKAPEGGSAVSSVPARTWHSQEDPRPPGTRLTVMRGSGPTRENE